MIAKQRGQNDCLAYSQLSKSLKLLESFLKKIKQKAPDFIRSFLLYKNGKSISHAVLRSPLSFGCSQNIRLPFLPKI
jgi:hypothetical protein